MNHIPKTIVSDLIMSIIRSHTWYAWKPIPKHLKPNLLKPKNRIALKLKPPWWKLSKNCFHMLFKALKSDFLFKKIWLHVFKIRNHMLGIKLQIACLIEIWFFWPPNHMLGLLKLDCMICLLIEIAWFRFANHMLNIKIKITC